MSQIDKLVTKIANLEIRITFQDQTIEDLNKTITGQWDEFEKVKREISRLKAQLNDVQNSFEGTGSSEPPPPHY